MPRPRPAERRPDPPPLEADEPRVAAVGTVVFTAGLVAALVLRDRLAEAGLEWLVWSCVTGIVLGLVGSVYTRRRREALARGTVPAEREAHQPELPVRKPHTGTGQPAAEKPAPTGVPGQARPTR